MKKCLFWVVLVLFSLQHAEAQISSKKLIKEYKKAIKDFKTKDDFFDAQFTAKGEANVGQMKMPIAIYVQAGKMRLEMELMGTKFYQVKNDSINWEYDPFEDAFQFEIDPEGGSFTDFNSNNDPLLVLEDGFEATTVEEVSLDSIQAYKLTLTKEEEADQYFYFDTRTYYVIGSGSGESIDYFMDYTVIDGWLFPATFIGGGDDDGLNMRVKGYDFDAEIDPALFEMSPEAAEAYADFLAKENEPEVSLVQRYFAKGQAHDEAGDYDLAIEAYNYALKESPNSITVLNARGLSKVEKGDHYGAIADFNRAAELSDEPSSTLQNNLGWAKFNLGDYKSARADYEAAIAINANNITYHENLGRTLFRLQDYEAATATYTQAIALDSTNYVWYYNRALAYALMENYRSAVGDYDKAEALGAEEAGFYNHKGVTLYSLEEYEAAFNYFKKASEGDASNTQFLINAGKALDAVGEFEEGRDYYDRVLELDTTNHSIYAERALTQRELKLFTLAKNDIDQAIKLSPKSAVYYDYRAYIKEDLGDYMGAVEDYTTSLNLEQDPNIYYLRGLAKLNLNNKADACLDLKKADEQGHEQAKEALTENCKL